MADVAETNIWNSGTSKVITVPAKLFNDSSFPFAEGEELLMRIDGNKLIIESGGKKK